MCFASESFDVMKTLQRIVRWIGNFFQKAFFRILCELISGFFRVFRGVVFELVAKELYLIFIASTPGAHAQVNFSHHAFSQRQRAIVSLGRQARHAFTWEKYRVVASLVIAIHAVVAWLYFGYQRHHDCSVSEIGSQCVWMHFFNMLRARWSSTQRLDSEISKSSRM